jgi:hypothetical protein
VMCEYQGGDFSSPDELSEFLKNQFPNTEVYHENIHGPCVFAENIGHVCMEDKVSDWDIDGAVSPEYCVTNIYILLMCGYEVTIEGSPAMNELQDNFDISSKKELMDAARDNLISAAHRVDDGRLYKAADLFLGV